MAKHLLMSGSSHHFNSMDLSCETLKISTTSLEALAGTVIHPVIPI